MEGGREASNYLQPNIGRNTTKAKVFGLEVLRMIMVFESEDMVYFVGCLALGTKLYEQNSHKT